MRRPQRLPYTSSGVALSKLPTSTTSGSQASTCSALTLAWLLRPAAGFVPPTRLM
jgi:hypothetical protein